MKFVGFRSPALWCLILAAPCPALLFPTTASLADDAADAAVADSTNEAIDPHLQKIFDGAAPESAADLRAMEEHWERLTEKLQKSTVGVRVGPAHGSGVIVKDGFVLTAGHVVVLPDRDAAFILHDGSMVRGKTLGMNAEIDSGMMKLNDNGDFSAAELGDSSKLRRGQWVLALGHPGGYEPGRKPVLRLGRILQIDDEAIQTDCTLVGGDSGGPLFDMQGRVIAIHSRIGEKLIANLHVPINTYKETWDRLEAAESWGYPLASSGPYIGVEGDRDLREAKIVKVTAGSPAAKAGIQPGDIVTKFDGDEIEDFDSLARLVQAHRPGEEVKVEIRRQVDGQEKTLELDLEIGNRE